MARQNKVASDKKKHRIPRSPRHRPISPRRSPEKRMSSPKFLRIKSTNSVTTSVGSDTSEEELDHDVKVRRLWMNRLRPRDKSNKTNTTNINSNKGKGKLIENGNKNNEKKTPSQKRNIATKTNATTTTATTTKRRYMGARRFNSTSSHEASEMVGSSKATTSSLKKDTKVYPVRHSARQIKPRKQAQG
ncbi:hypothetical protein BC941DRAFT_418753 [Chlamydoabsidia padenii]|nr:hypothetical protein BC941DRAFT_418753 [Chlamydoabsidia padenii]